jgi:UDP-glucose 4-epimerase
MKILITGGAGFIGSHTAELFVQAGHDVAILDNFSTGSESNLDAVKGEIDLINGDIRDEPVLERACRNIDAIVHLAAISSVEKSMREPLVTHSVNATGTLGVIEAAHGAGIRKIVFSSSAAVYGDHPELPKKESSPVEPHSPYAWHKLTGEFYGKTYKELYDLEFVSLRYFNVYGPRQDPDSPYSGVLSIFIRRALNHEPLIIYGDGQQTRDFIHVSDVARVNLLAIEAKKPLPALMNVGTGQEVKVIDAAKMIGNALHAQTPIEHRPVRTGDIKRSYSDPQLMNEIYGFESEVKIETGLVDLIRSFEGSPDQLN